MKSKQINVYEFKNILKWPEKCLVKLLSHPCIKINFTHKLF